MSDGTQVSPPGDQYLLGQIKTIYISIHIGTLNTKHIHILNQR